jgi:uncharacterized repeat protein (TIGR01451 family)
VIGGVIPTYDLSVTNTAPATITLGSNLTYTIKVSNSKSDTATGLSLSGAINPSNFASITAPGWGCSTPLFTGTVTCTRASLASNSSSTITLVVTPTATGSLSNMVTVTSTGNDTDSSNNTATATVTVQNQGADISLTGTAAPNPVNVGGNLTYTFTARNNGPGGATNVAVVDILPAGVTFVSANSSGGSCTMELGQVGCGLGSLANGATATATIVVTAQAGAAPSISNTASVSATEPDPNSANNSATVTTTVNAVADMAVTMTASANTVQVGSNVTYAATVKNNGPSTASSVTLTDTLPANVTLFGANIPSGVSCNLPAAKIICTLGSPLSSGASFTIAFILIPQAAAVPSITHTVTVSAAETDPNNTNNTASVTTTVTPAPTPDFSMTASPASATVQPGGAANVTFTLTPANGFTGSVNLACTGAPAATTCSASPNPVQVNGNNPVQATVTLQTTAPTKSAGLSLPANPGTMTLLLLLALSGIMIIWLRSARVPRLRIAFGTAFALSLVMLLAGCGGHSQSLNGGTPKGTFTVNVTGASGQISHSSTITLNVGP